jgi:NAD(P)-dependent dehydrogenase (short-subunit alcohol dehydrogenase family)
MSPHPPFDLTDRVAIVTGSSRGIGRSIVETLAALGARVVVSSRKADACEAVAAGIRERGGEALVVPCNMSDRRQVDELVDRTLEALGRVDVLVCNAAANPVYGSMLDVDDAAFHKIIDTNVRSNMWLCHRVLPQMAERRDGSIVIVSSIAGLSGSRMIGTYAISKAADFQLARNLAVEWGRHDVRVNCIAPGLIRTDFARALWEDPAARQRIERGTPLGRIGEPDDIAGAAAFLAAPASRYMTGQTLVVDGGVMIRDTL